MQLYIIRHCQSQNNELWKRTGSSNGRLADPPLTATGCQQAELLAQHLADPLEGQAWPKSIDNSILAYDITHLYCSLMRRSVETGLAIAEALALPLVVREDIHERGGIYLENPESQEREGLPGPDRDYFQTTYPSLVLPDTLGEVGWWNRPYEDREMALSRAAAFLRWFVAEHDGTEDRVAMVTHAGFMQSLFQTLFQSPMVDKELGATREIWFKANNGSISRIDFMEEVIRITYQNRVDYLPAHLIT
jgi:2,3-bisphosphoglycerate-dependent phosphoglycerate mutase